MISLPPYDLERIEKRFDAWLQGAIFDRPPVTCLPVWRTPCGPLPEKKHASPLERALDAEFHVARFEKIVPCLEYSADTVPTFVPTIGIGQVAAVLGGKIELNEHSCWAVHSLPNVRDVIGRVADLNHPVQTALRTMTKLSLAASRGRWLTGVGFGCNSPDVLVDLRGPQELCFDLMDDPEGVRLACAHIDSQLPAIYNDLRRPIAEAGQPTAINGEGVIWNGEITRLEGDFLCMVSKATAEEVFYPLSKKRIRAFERCYWHADGPGWLTHLDFLLQDEQLGAIQWVYGTGNGPAAKWIDVYRKIQAAGKGIELMPESVEDALAVMKHLKPEGVWFKFWRPMTTAESNQFIAETLKPSNWA